MIKSCTIYSLKITLVSQLVWINNEYLDLMNFNEKDIFKRLRQSYKLQIDLLQQHPWIFDFIKITDMTNSVEINKKLEKEVAQKLARCHDEMFDIVDEAKFREGLNLERCKQVIFWTNVGFTNQILGDIRHTKITQLDYDKIQADLDSYLNELEAIFYR